jgi:hypothetical protein
MLRSGIGLAAWDSYNVLVDEANYTTYGAPALGGFAAGDKIAFGIVKFLATRLMSTDWKMRRGSLLQKIPAFSLIQIKVGVSRNGNKSRWPAINAREATP